MLLARGAQRGQNDLGGHGGTRSIVCRDFSCSDNNSQEILQSDLCRRNPDSEEALQNQDKTRSDQEVRQRLKVRPGTAPARQVRP
jgi:hypothetical protein